MILVERKNGQNWKGKKICIDTVNICFIPIGHVKAEKPCQIFSIQLRYEKSFDSDFEKYVQTFIFPYILFAKSF